MLKSWLYIILFIIKVCLITSQNIQREFKVNEDKRGTIIVLAPDPPVASENFRPVEGLPEIFRVSTTLGEVILNDGRVLDPPTNSLYNFRVEVFNKENNNTIRVENITLEILDVKPTIIRTFNEKPLVEKAVLFQQRNTEENTVVIQIRAQDVNPNTKFIYSFVPGREVDAKNRFRIVPEDGRVVTVGRTQFPEDYQYILCFRATDSRNFRSYADIEVAVYTALQPPMLSEPVQDLYLSENIPIRTQFGEIKAQPINYVFDKLTYKISKNFFNDPNVPFSIEADGRMIKTNNVDFESLYSTGGRLGWLFITEVLENGTNPNYGVIRISVSDSNDNSPVFITPLYVTADVKEDTKPGTVITEISPYDQDTDIVNRKMTYSVSDSEFFLVKTNPVNQKAQLYLAKEVDFDNQKVRFPFYDVTLTGEDDKNITTTTKVRVYVSNANDNAPMFDKTSYNVSVNSNAGTGEQVAFLQAWDIDGSTISYYFLNENTNAQVDTISPFRIQQNTGEITVISTINQPLYNLKVVAEDGGDCVFCSSQGTKLKTTLDVNIRTTEINANKPSFTNCPTQLTVNERAEAETKIGQVTATDNDPSNSLSGQISFLFVENWIVRDFQKYLQINESTGEIYTTNILDREDLADNDYFNQFYFTVKATDKGTPPRHSLCNFKLVVLDVNDNIPIFYPKEYMYVLKRSRSYNNEPLLRLNSYDLDSGANANVDYSIVSGPSTGFSITSQGADAGVLTYTGSQASDTSFELKVEARNSAPLVGITTPWNNVVVKIWVRDDVNLQMPSLVLQPGLSKFLFETTIKEDVAQSYLVGTFRANPPAGAVDYSMSWVNNFGPTRYLNNLQLNFIFGDSNGAETNLTTNNSPRPQDAQFLAIAKLSKDASDATVGTIYTYLYVRVNIDDVNNQKPIFLNPFVDFESIPETIRVNEQVTKFFVFDLDRKVEYQESEFLKLPASGDGQYFNLNAVNGELTIAVNNLKNVGKSSFTFNIRAKNKALSNKNTPSQTEQPLNLKLSDVNDNAPTFSGCTVNAVNEDIPINSKLGQVTATDSDIASNLNYQIKQQPQTEQSRIHVDPITGEIYSSYPLYIESAVLKNYTYEIEVSDGLNKDTCNLNLNVNPVQFPPKFSERIYRFTTSETATGVIGKVAATMNTAASGSSMRYTIEGKFASSFNMNPTTGELSVVSPLDRDPPYGLEVYELAAKAVWLANSKESYALILVTITDVNDNGPIFLAKDLYYELPVGTPIDTIFATLRVTDVDTAPNSGVTFSLPNNDDHPNITLDAQGNMRPKQEYQNFGDNPDFRDRTFSVEVVATPAPNLCCGKPNTPVSANIMVSVVDKTNNPPVFNPTTVTIPVPENTEVGRQVGSVRANDPDLHDHKKLVYSYQNTIPGFSLVNLNDVDSAAFQLDIKLDYEDATKRSFGGQVKVVDSSNNEAFVTVTIQVTNVIEAPTITANPTSSTIQENSQKGTLVTSITVSNMDSEHASGFNFFVDPTTNPLNLFAIGTPTSSTATTVILNNSPDREVLTSDNKNAVIPLAIILQPRQPNSGPPFRHIVQVTITDSNDNRPFLSVLEGMTIEKLPTGSIIIPQAFPIIDQDLSDKSTIVASKANPQSAEWQLFNLVRLTNTSSGFNAVQLQNSGQLTATKLFKLPVSLTDSVNTGESELRVLVLPPEPDSYRRYYKSSEIVVPETWTWFYRDKDASLVVTNVYTIFPVTAEKLAQRKFSIIDSNTDEVKLYFRVSDNGVLTVLGRVVPGKYDVLVDATEPDKPIWKYQVNVTITFVPNEAIQKSSSFRVSGITPEQFMAKRSDGKDVDTAEDSLHTRFRRLIAESLGTTIDKVDFIAVLLVPNQLATDVFFAVHGSPYYSPAIINAMMKQQSKELEDILKSVNPALTLSQSPIDMCGDEGQAMLKCPSGGCQTVFVSNTQPDRKDSRLNSGIDVNLIPSYRCGCTTCEDKKDCTDDHCLNGGVCSKEYGTHTLTCTCRPGFSGPRCQHPHLTFVSPGGYSMYAGFPDGCSDVHVSFEFITSTKSQHQLLFYAGPLDAKISDPPVVLDFLAIILKSDSVIEISVNLGSGVTTKPLTPREDVRNNKWHRIDLVLKDSQVTLILDLCVNTPLAGVNEEVDYSRCKVSFSASTFNKALNLKGAPIQLGGRAPRQPGLQADDDHYPKIVSDSEGSFIGTFLNLRVNNKLLDLYSHKLQKNIQLNVVMNNPDLQEGCLNSQRQPMCGSNGVCTTVLKGALASGSCVCKAGYRNGPTGICDTATEIKYLRRSSLLRWRISPAVQDDFDTNFKKTTEISLMFRSRNDGTLITIDGFWNIYYKLVKLEIRIRNSQLEFIPNFGDYKNLLYTLPNKNVNDGAWHHVRIKRVLRSVEIQMDDGEGCNYLFSPDVDTTTYNYLTPQMRTLVGALADPTPRVPEGSIYPEDSDLVDTCIQDVRLNGYWLPVTDAENKLPRNGGTLEEVKNVENKCPEPSGCPGVCPTGLFCLPVWNPIQSPFCGCPTTHHLLNNRCLGPNPCFPDPCFNVGRCVYKGDDGYECKCEVGLYNKTEKDCNPTSEPVIGLAAGYIALIVILLLLLLLLLIFLLWFFLCYKKMDVLLPPDEDIRENIKYYDGNAGEVDTDNYDIAKLKDALRITTTGPGTVPVKIDTGTLLTATYTGEGAPPQDYTLDYGYEGQGSVIDELSLLGSDTTDASQNFDYLKDSGAPFNRLADLYNPRA